MNHIGLYATMSRKRATAYIVTVRKCSPSLLFSPRQTNVYTHHTWHIADHDLCFWLLYKLHVKCMLTCIYLYKSYKNSQTKSQMSAPLPHDHRRKLNNVQFIFVILRWIIIRAKLFSVSCHQLHPPIKVGLEVTHLGNQVYRPPNDTGETKEPTRYEDW